MNDANDKPLILLVDDMTAVASLTQETIEELGYEAAVRQNATTAIAFVGNHDVDLIMIDVDLADSLFSGIQTAKLIQSKKDIPIVFITAHDEIKSFRKADFNSPIYVMLKPYDTRQLKMQIEVALYNREIAEKPPVIVF